MSAYDELIQRIRDDRVFREALAAAATPEDKRAVVRAAGLGVPTSDEILAGVSGGVSRAFEEE